MPTYAPVRRLAFAAAVLCLMGTRARSGELPTLQDEYRAKALFVYNVATFTEWPDAVLTDRSPVTVAVLGREAGRVIRATLEGRTVNGRPVVVRVHERARDVEPCHLVFVASDAAREQVDLLERLARKPVLTISEVPAATPHQPIVSLVVVGVRLAFDVDMDAAEVAGVRPHARLLSLAREVRGARTRAAVR